MKNKHSLIVFIFLCANYFGFGQISITGLGAVNTYTQDFNTMANTGTSNTVPTGWSFSESGSNTNATYTAGTGGSNTGDTYSFGSSTSTERSFGGLQSASLIPTIGASFINNTGYSITDLIISYKGETWRIGATSRSDRLDFQYSINATSLSTGTWTDYNALDYTNSPQVSTSSGSEIHSSNISSTISSLNIINGGTFSIRWLDFNAAGADDGMAIDDFSIYVLGATDEVDWCNLQTPNNGSTNQCGDFDVYARTYEAGITNIAGADANIKCWIGYNTTNAISTSDFTSPDWTWVQANYNVQVGNDDEYMLNLGNEISTAGTYYYVSRFQYNGGPYKYGGYNAGGGGFWDGSSNISGILTVSNEQVNFCNVQSPKSLSIITGHSDYIYAQVYEPGITDSPGEGTQIDAWIGYNTIGENYQPWVDSGTDWTWIQATYNPSCLDCNGGQNDEYYIEIGCDLPAGTYYYASRFQINCNDYSYGGIQSDGVGNFWTLNTINNGTLTVTDPPLADVVITEIMYNSSGTDDEWIEICNISGSTQDLSNYTIVVTGGNADGVVFTFPCDTTIANGVCITIDLGNGGAGVYNDDCTFTATYSNGFGAGTLGNTNGTITLKSTNGTTCDTIAYDSSDGGSPHYSIHVIDATQDNSDTGTNWQEVAYGGSWGTNSLLPNCLPAGVEINVESNLSNYPDIIDGDISPSFLDNTLFAAQFVGASQSKSYRIQSLLATDVIISNITITGDFSDFSITGNPNSPVNYLSPSILEITFTPTVPGTRTAVVHIFNNDADEGEYTFTIEGEGKCVGVIDAISPASGPAGTIVSVSTTGIDLNSASAYFNGVAATTVNYISATDELEVTVPNGAADGNLELVDGSGCTGIIAFDVIDTKISSCGGVGGLSDLIISEITDSTTGGMTYIELYNGTGNPISLNGYSLEIISNGTSSGNTVNLNNVILANDDTYVVAIGVVTTPDTTDPGADTCPIDINGNPVGNGELADQTSTVGGINKKDNEHDMIRLVYSGSTIDTFGVYEDNDWMDSTIVTGNRGFNFRRLNTASPLPNPVFNINDWNVIDWVGQGITSCSTNDYSDIGFFDFSTGTPPSVSSGPTINSSCNTATIGVSGTEGSDPAGLAYQWYVSAPGDNGWTLLINGATYNNVDKATLNILDTSILEGYQYYCQIREDDASCYTASDAVQLTLPTTKWDGTSWSSTPTIDKIAIIDGDYDTATSGSFEACSLIINSGNELNVRDYTYVKIQNNVIVDGSVIVQTHGAFVQVDDSGTFTLNPGGTSSVIKETALIKKWYEYTYWSSPVKNQKVEDAFPDTPINRRFWYKAENYLDSTKEVGNNNQTISGQDDIDDNGDDWQIASGASTMTKGLGYAATSSQFGMFPRYDQATFEGEFHTGEVNVDIYRNDTELLDNNWNLLGNPYPSAISADLFLSVNSVVDNSVDENVSGGVTDGAIFFWSQESLPSKNNNGNENENFAQSDYAIINTFTQTKGGDDVTPNRYIPSGQGFFISYANGTPGTLQSGNIYKGTVKFTNSMRMADGTSNSQFFRTSETSSKKSTKLSNTLWVNLISDNGVFNQLAIGYVQGASNSDDGMSYDTQRNLSNPLYSSIYTMIDGEDKKFAIQGKDPNSLNVSEIIPLGFDTTIDVSTLYTLSIPQVEGEFLISNPIYLKDNFMNIVHNLSESDYTFTSEVGEFKDRFEIVFQSEALSDIELQQNTKMLSIIELQDGRVQFKTNNDLTIQLVQIIDMLGRTLYQLKGSSASEIYNLNTLSQSAYIAKVELSNGQVITKRAVKRK